VDSPHLDCNLGTLAAHTSGDLAAPWANLTLAELVADVNKRTIKHGTTDVLTLVFEKNASLAIAGYTGALTTTGVVLTILP
jgi:hypothetical protein